MYLIYSINKILVKNTFSDEQTVSISLRRGFGEMILINQAFFIKFDLDEKFKTDRKIKSKFQRILQSDSHFVFSD